MWTIIILAIIGLITGLTIASKSLYPDLWDYIAGCFWGLLVGSVIGLFVAIALPAKTIYVSNSSFQIESLQDNNSVNGNFFLGCGNINGVMKYVFYYKEEDNTYKMMQINYNQASIKYTDGQPYVIVYNWKCSKDSFINYFAIDSPERDYYIIHIPKASIKNSYSLDSQ